MALCYAMNMWQYIFDNTLNSSATKANKYVPLGYSIVPSITEEISALI